MTLKVFPKNIKVVFDKNKENLLAFSGKAISDFINKEKDKQVLFLTSGGSAFQILDYIDDSILKTNLTVAVLDERYSNDPKINNFKQLKQTKFYKKARAKKVNFISTEILKGKTLEKSGQQFNQNLKNWKSKNPHGKIVATLGIGEDGHTSGIMPFPENPKLFKKLFEDKNRWVIGYDAGEKTKYSKRITTTISFIQSTVNTSIFFAVGENKAEILANLFRGDFTLEKTPFMLIHRLKNVTLFTDINLSN